MIFVSKITPTKNLFINLNILWELNVNIKIIFIIEYIKNNKEKFLNIKNFEVFISIKTGGSKNLNELLKKVYKKITKTSKSNVKIVTLSANLVLFWPKNSNDKIE